MFHAQAKFFDYVDVDVGAPLQFPQLKWFDVDLHVGAGLRIFSLCQWPLLTHFSGCLAWPPSMMDTFLSHAPNLTQLRIALAASMGSYCWPQIRQVDVKITPLAMDYAVPGMINLRTCFPNAEMHRFFGSTCLGISYGVNVSGDGQCRQHTTFKDPCAELAVHDVHIAWQQTLDTSHKAWIEPRWNEHIRMQLALSTLRCSTCVHAYMELIKGKYALHS
jgi:hypothetical protein